MHTAYKLEKYGFSVHKSTSHTGKEGYSPSAHYTVYFQTATSPHAEYSCWGDISEDEPATVAKELRFVERGRIQCFLFDQENEYLHIPSHPTKRSSSEDIPLSEYVNAMNSGHAVVIFRDGDYYGYEVVADGDCTGIDNIVEIHTAKNLIILS